MKACPMMMGAAVVAASLALVAPPVAAQAPAVELPQSAAAVVVEYTVFHQMLADNDPTPLLRVYADGRVRVHYPVYMSRAGDYETLLAPDELQGLLADLVADGVLDFDAEATLADRAAAAAAARAAGRLYHVSDVSVTRIDVRVGSYRAPGTSQAIPDFEKNVAWPNVYTDARRFAGVSGVQGLARAEERLRAIMQRDDLTRIR